jgi:hypothetical protein
MPYHWGGSFTIDQITVKAVSPEVTPIPGPQPLARLVGKKASKASLKSRGPKAGTPAPTGVIAFELTFKSRVTDEEVTLRVPAVGAFHDPAQRTALSDVKKLGVEVAKALNRVFHADGKVD